MMATDSGLSLERHAETGRRQWHAPVAIAGLATAFWIAISWALLRPSADGGAITYVDADCYTRLERVTEIVENGQYPFRRFPRSNPPTGETSHWGLPMDALLIAGAALLAPITGSFASGLDAWSVWVGPALFAVFALAMIRCAVRLGGVMAGGGLAIMVLGSQAILHPFLPARPDHHGLSLVLHALAFASLAGAEIDAARGPGERARFRWGISVSAACAAVAVWVSVESCALVGLVGGWLALRVGWPGTTPPECRLQMLLRWATVLWFTLLAAWIIERGGIRGPYLWGTDALSPRFLLPGAVALAAIALFAKTLSGDSRIARLSALGAVAIVAALAWALPPRAFPGLPMPETDYPLMLGFLDRASTDGLPMFGGPSPGPRNFLEWYGAVVPFLPIAAIVTLRARGITGPISALALACAFAYAALGLLKMRWCSYAMTFASLAVACWLAEGIGARVSRWRPRPSIALPWCATLAAATLIGFSGRIAASHWPGSGAPAIPAHAVDGALRAAHAAWEHDLAARGVSSRRVLTHACLGPQVMHLWTATVLATPNVRNGAGIRKLFRWLSANDTSGALREIVGEGWDYALIIRDPFPPEVEAFRRFGGMGQNDGPSLLDALERCPPHSLVGEWPLGPGGTTMRLVRLPASEAAIAEWLARKFGM